MINRYDEKRLGAEPRVTSITKESWHKETNNEAKEKYIKIMKKKIQWSLSKLLIRQFFIFVG